MCIDAIPVSDDPIPVKHGHSSAFTSASESEVATANTTITENSQDHDATLQLIDLSSCVTGKHD